MTTLGNRLLELIADRKIVPFIGAGFSIPSGVPSWDRLVKGLIDNYSPDDSRPYLQGIYDRADKSDVTEVLDSLSVTDFAIKEYLAEQIKSPKYQPSDYHKLLLELRCDTIITTNWDVLIETALQNISVSERVIYRDNDVAQYDPNRDVQVLKIHGTISDMDSLVYRKSHYEKYWEERPAMLSLVSTLMATKSFLFIGYGLGDPNILSLLEILKGRLGRTRREHYALTFNNNMARAFQMLGIVQIPAPNFRPDVLNFEESTLDFLRELSGKTRGVSLSNFERARLINLEIDRLIRRMPPKPMMRMRGSLGWLSNPVPVPGDPIYGSDIQDAEERRMTESICRFLENPMATLRCILHLDMEPLLRRGYKAHHLVRRLSTVKEMVERYRGRIAIVHDPVPSQLNHMIFDDTSSLIGFKGFQLGIDRATFGRDRATVRIQVGQFDDDFEEIQNQNKYTAAKKGVNVDQTGWLDEFILKLIEDQINKLSSRTTSVNVDSQEVNSLKGVIMSPKLPEGALLFSEALEFGVRKHTESGQTREDGVTPYAVHIIRVIERLRAVGLVDDYEMLAAAALHDVVEDCGVSLEELAARFGERVSTIVSEVTKGSKEPGQDYTNRLRSASTEAKCIKLADRWDNVSDLKAFKKEQFGKVSSQEYLEEAQQVLSICKEANEVLAANLEAEIKEAQAVFE